MGTSTREIISLHIGNFSNFIGTHWWNLQESGFIYSTSSNESPTDINNDVLFREGQTLMGDVTYTPRLLVVDHRESLKSLKQDGVLYDLPSSLSEENKSRCAENVSLHRTSPTAKNKFLTDLDIAESSTLNSEEDARMELDDTNGTMVKVDSSRNISDGTMREGFGSKFYDLDDSVTSWSDFLRIHLHPKSILVLPSRLNAREQTEDIFTSGLTAFSDQDSLTDLEDRLHFFAEDCDSLQGFHVIADGNNSFGGVGARLLQMLADDYPGKAMMTFSVFPPLPLNTNSSSYTRAVLSSALSLEALAGHSSLLVPLSLASPLYTPQSTHTIFPYLNYKPDLKYHTSAILAAAIDTETLPYRLNGRSVHMAHITDTFSAHSRKLATLSACLPLPLSPASTLVDALMQYNNRIPWQTLTPYTDHLSVPTHQSVVVRGLPLKPPESLSKERRSDNDALRLYLSESYPQTLNGGCIVRDACHVTSPYPHIFSPRINSRGYLTAAERPSLKGVDRVAGITSLQSNDSISRLLRDLHLRSSRINVRKQHHFISASFEEDDFRESMSRLESLAEIYEK